ncbi:hypothetical protein AGMMS49975_03100 [Clostridia bacterium]|nr:hypothetical protein AGMMS49975_03100 [Clostridia bacterium]
MANSDKEIEQLYKFSEKFLAASKGGTKIAEETFAGDMMRRAVGNFVEALSFSRAGAEAEVSETVSEILKMSEEVLQASKTMNLKVWFGKKKDKLQKARENFNDAFESYHGAVSGKITKYGLAIETARAGLWYADIASGDLENPGSKFAWSDELRSMLGFSGTGDFPNVYGSFIERIHPDDAKRAVAAFADHLNDRTGRTAYGLKCRLRLKSGEYRWFHASGNTIRGAGGEAVSFTGVLRDINDTEELRKSTQLIKSYKQAFSAIGRLCAEIPANHLAKIDTEDFDGEIKAVTDKLNDTVKALCDKTKDLQTHFDLVSQAAHIGICDMEILYDDLNKNTPVWSDELRRLVGYSNEHDFPNTLNSWSDKIHPDDLSFVFEAVSSVLDKSSGRTHYDTEYRMRHKNGEYLWFRFYGLSFRDKSGNPKKLVGGLENIHARKTFDDDVKEYMSELEETIKQTTKIIREIADVSKSIKDAQEVSVQTSEKTDKSIRNSAHIIETIKDISVRTNLLGVNAVIETAHIGALGVGFKVIATEIRDLAAQCKKSSESIEKDMREFRGYTEKIGAQIKSVAELSDAQGKITAELETRVGDINRLCHEFNSRISSSNTV